MWKRDASPQTSPLQTPPAPPVPAAPAARPQEERRTVAWVGKSVLFKGELTSSEDMTIDGRVEGTIEVRDHALTIGPDADIHAKVVARSVTVHGSVHGTITARERVEIRETGSVMGDITSPRLVMIDGAVLKGRVDAGPKMGAQVGVEARLSAVG
jgi:cytoskeletal protein CcmA (bactofilin family)